MRQRLGPTLCVPHICAVDGFHLGVSLVNLGHRMMLQMVLQSKESVELAMGARATLTVGWGSIYRGN